MTEATTEIELEGNDAGGRYVLRGPGGAEAEITFRRPDRHQLIIDHTTVPDVFRGQGVGTKLVARVVEDARAAGVKIVPLCPFAAAQFARHPEWAGVLKQ